MEYNKLILSGGALKGLLTLGSLQYLYDNNKLKNVTKYIGTSVGSMICFLISIGYTPIELIVSICTSQIFDKVRHIDIISLSNNEGGIDWNIINEYLETLDCKKHIIIGMMANKEHEKYISYFKDISSLTTIDIPNQPNAISGKELREKFKSIPNVQYKKSIKEAIQSINLKKNDLLVITGSLYLSGEFLNLN